MKRPVRISGAGCCLVDQIHPDMDFSDPAVMQFMSNARGDGGLHPGRLVFSEQFESFAGKDLDLAVEEMTESKKEPVFNVGGPSIVALIHAAQMLQGMNSEVCFYGNRGNDPAGIFLQSKLEQTPVNLLHLSITEGSTPSTIVLSDPNFNKGNGERMFINNIGAAWNFAPGDLDDHFFTSEIVVFGGTALVPSLHEGLSELLAQAKSSGCLTVVNTVYDFRSELLSPGKLWMLGKSYESYRHIDLLIMDREEAQHLSGFTDLREACSYFLAQGASACIITNGSDELFCDCQGDRFKTVPKNCYPVSDAILADLKNNVPGDTTGCGDNFVGGVLTSLAWQLSEGSTVLDLEQCIAWGTVSGGNACFQLGGTSIESHAGEKFKAIRPYYELYMKQING